MKNNIFVLFRTKWIIKKTTVPLLAALLLTPLAGASAAEKGGFATLENLRCEYLVNPSGMGEREPRLSWTMRDDSGVRGATQTDYQILVASSPEKLARDEGDLWDSGRVHSEKSIQIVYGGKPLESRARCHWKVRAWLGDRKETPWSEPAFWTMGLLRADDWKSGWLRVEEPAPQTAAGDKWIRTPRYLRRDFSAADRPVRATLYATALGLYEMRLNGQRVGDALLSPGWTSYDKRVQVQTYDVTPLVRKGANVVAALLGNGWYCGRIQCWPIDLCLYGNEPHLKAQLELEFANGKRQIVATDGAWQGSTDGPLRFSGIFEGETYDARKEMDGWDKPGFKSDARWQPATLDTTVKTGALVSQRDEPIRVTQELTPVAVTEPKPGIYVFDFGQNMVGWTRLKVQGEAGTELELSFAERVNPGGTVYRENLTTSPHGEPQAQMIRYILRGGKEETYEPHFTYMGFQYVEVKGLKQKPALSLLTGRVFHTDFRRAGNFTCSDPLVNRLAENIRWSQRGNMMGVPTDCPQRSERCGWAGDAQVFMPTAVYNYDMAAFLSKWLDDLCEDSFFKGKGFADFAPFHPPLSTTSRFGRKIAATAWSDAGIICPDILYRTYGDTRAIERHYANMKKHLLAVAGDDANGFRKRTAWGDWLNVGGGINNVVCALAYQIYLADLMAEMAGAIGKNEDVAAFRTLATKSRAIFASEFIAADGSIKESSQTGYVLALTMGLVPDAMREKVAGRFKNEMDRFGYNATGVIGSPRLLFALQAVGREDEAYRLLLRRDYPSWLYSVTLGATTCWERWDSLRGWWPPNRDHLDKSMNSFNHCWIGSCGQFLFAGVGGITALEPGYRRFEVAPVIRDGLYQASASYDSIYGTIVSKWMKQDRKTVLTVTVPPNTQAEIRLPAASFGQVTESGQPLAKAAGLALASEGNGEVHVQAAAGSYVFECQDTK